MSTSQAGEGETDMSRACRNDIFLDVAKLQGSRGSDAAPKLTVTCSETDMTVRSNGMPHYTDVSTTPNPLSPKNHEWTVPKDGAQLATPT